MATVATEDVKERIARLAYQVDRSIAGLFAQADPDNKGFATVGHVRSALKRLGTPVEADQLDALCSSLADGSVPSTDGTNDGAVVEFSALRDALQLSHPHEPCKQRLCAAQRALLTRPESLQEFFLSQLSNHDNGFMSIGMLHKAFKRLGVALSNWMELQEIFRYADSKGDGAIDLKEFDAAFAPHEHKQELTRTDGATLRSAYTKIWRHRLSMLDAMTQLDTDLSGTLSVEHFKQSFHPVLRTDIGRDTMTTETELPETLKTVQIHDGRVDYAAFLDQVNRTIIGEDSSNGGSGEGFVRLNEMIFNDTEMFADEMKKHDPSNSGVVPIEDFRKRIVSLKAGVPLNGIEELASNFFNATLNGVDYAELIASRILVDHDRFFSVVSRASAKLKEDRNNVLNTFGANAGPQGAMTRTEFYHFLRHWIAPSEVHALLAALDIPLGAHVIQGDLHEAIDADFGNKAISPQSEWSRSRVISAKRDISSRAGADFAKAEAQAAALEKSEATMLVGEHADVHPSRRDPVWSQNNDDAVCNNARAMEHAADVWDTESDATLRAEAAAEKLMREFLKMRPQPQQPSAATRGSESATRYVARELEQMTADEVAQILCDATQLPQYKAALSSCLPGKRLVRLQQPNTLSTLGIINHAHQARLWSAISAMRRYYHSQEACPPTEKV